MTNKEIFKSLDKIVDALYDREVGRTALDGFTLEEIAKHRDTLTEIRTEFYKVKEL